jgi:DNA mismatch repair ATPase MutL
VRFREPQAVYLAVRDAVLQAVRRFRMPARAEPIRAAFAPEAQSVSDAPRVMRLSEIAVSTGFEALPELPRQDSLALSGALVEPSGGDPETFRFSDLRYIGQALKCYLLCEKEGELHVLDMHAAHERYNYNLVRNGFRGRALPSQRLLVPLTVELTLEGVRRVAALKEDLEAAGFDIEPFGETTAIVRAAPALVTDGDIALLVRELAADNALGTGALEERIDRLAARIACHGSIRSGEELTREEAYALFEALDRSEFSAACPHGRPVIVRFAESDIERWFGRDR